MDRAQILDIAKQVVTGERSDKHGEPEESFTTIAKMWEAFTGYDFEPEQVAIMLALLKIARIKTGVNNEDNFIDIAGYAACAGELAEFQ